MQSKKNAPPHCEICPEDAKNTSLQTRLLSRMYHIFIIKNVLLLRPVIRRTDRSIWIMTTLVGLSGGHSHNCMKKAINELYDTSWRSFVWCTYLLMQQRFVMSYDGWMHTDFNRKKSIYTYNLLKNTEMFAAMKQLMRKLKWWRIQKDNQCHQHMVSLLSIVKHLMRLFKYMKTQKGSQPFLSSTVKALTDT